MPLDYLLPLADLLVELIVGCGFSGESVLKSVLSGSVWPLLLSLS